MSKNSDPKEIRPYRIWPKKRTLPKQIKKSDSFWTGHQILKAKKFVRNQTLQNLTKKLGSQESIILRAVTMNSADSQEPKNPLNVLQKLKKKYPPPPPLPNWCWGWVYNEKMPPSDISPIFSVECGEGLVIGLNTSLMSPVKDLLNTSLMIRSQRSSCIFDRPLWGGMGRLSRLLVFFSDSNERLQIVS